MTEATEGFNQDDILRIYDVLIGGVVAEIILVLAAIYLSNTFFILGAIVETIGLALGFMFIKKEKTRLTKLGKWKKLTLKESFDLHEWRNLE